MLNKPLHTPGFPCSLGLCISKTLVHKQRESSKPTITHSAFCLCYAKSSSPHFLRNSKAPVSLFPPHSFQLGYHVTADPVGGLSPSSSLPRPCSCLTKLQDSCTTPSTGTCDSVSSNSFAEEDLRLTTRIKTPPTPFSIGCVCFRQHGWLQWV